MSDLTRFQDDICHIAPTSMECSKDLCYGMYNEETIIKILEGVNPEMASLVREYGIDKTLEALERLGLFNGISESPHPQRNGG